MSATFKQVAINVREALNALCGIESQVAKNTQALLPLKAYAGRNLLINGDNNITQRGDFSTPTPIVTSSYYVDRFKTVDSAGLMEISVGDYNLDAMARVVRYEATATGNTTFEHKQLLEDTFIDKGKTVTYTAWVRANFPVIIRFNDGIDGWDAVGKNAIHSGGGEWELLTATTVISKTNTAVGSRPSITNYFNGLVASVTIGDYVEIGAVQYELGSEATEFEHVDPATQFVKCRRYFRISEATGQAAEFAHEMRALPDESGAGPYQYDAEL